MQETINKFIEVINAKHEKGDSFRKSTAPTSSHGWSEKEHEAMKHIANKYRSQGHIVSSNYTHGVMDWEIHPKVTMEIKPEPLSEEDAEVFKEQYMNWFFDECNEQADELSHVIDILSDQAKKDLLENFNSQENERNRPKKTGVVCR